MKNVIRKTVEAYQTYREFDEKTYTTALILAAGSSTRMGKKISKQFLSVGGIPVLARTLIAYQKCPLIREIVVAARPEDHETVQALIEQYEIKKITALVSGGSSRAESAQNALNAVSPETKFVAVADGARCLIKPLEIARVCACAYKNKAASAACRVIDTVKRTGALGNVKETVDRENLWTVQTPQVFHLALYTVATERAKSDRFVPTDDNGLIEHLGYGVRLVECSRENIKITTPADIRLAEAILASRRKDKDDE